MRGAPGFGLHLAVVAFCVGVALSCADRSPGPREPPPAGDELFSQLPSGYTGVRFENRVVETADHNVFKYRNFYNGGGVALGDLTGDGLPELLLTSNLGKNRLYLNEGGFRFTDVTGRAGIAGEGSWATGVTFVDIDGDGWLDIHVAYAGDVEGGRRANELYIHQGLNAKGVPVFAESAAAYGIADQGYTTHAAFFDYDRDGDLDLYLINNSFRP
ncbi:MAG: FG-GAP repeat domain-containing protein, partial [Planctomycetota bacterium]